MISSEIASQLTFEDNGSKIILFVIDGVGGFPLPETGLTELETACTPNLDRLAAKGITGMTIPIAPGVPPGSGVAHLALFGYNPFRHAIGRGAIAAYGMGLDMDKGDMAVRVNFATYSSSGAVLKRRDNPPGAVLNRRGGLPPGERLSTEQSKELCNLLRDIKLPDVDIIIENVLDYRSVVIFKGENLHPHLSDSDPQATGYDVFPHEVKALDPKAKHAAKIANAFIKEANKILRKEAGVIARLPDEMHSGILTRGYSGKPEIPSMRDLYGLNKMGAIATYPDYRGVARIAGMDIVYDGHELVEEFEVLEKVIEDHDFIFFHVKKTDSAGEDGDFDKKVHLLEELDELVPRLEALNPDVIVITGDHATPAMYKAHSWHTVPFALVGEWCRPDDVKAFSESACQHGALGQFYATEVMLYALGHARRIAKFGA
jgi:2,3-bisphosphoglycerate-independent phosphoglycerate mutase